MNRAPTLLSAAVLGSILILGCAINSTTPMLQMPAENQRADPPSPVLAVQELADDLVQQLVVNLSTNDRLAIAVIMSAPAGMGKDNLQIVIAERLKAALFKSGRFSVLEDPEMEAVLTQYAIQDKLRFVLNEGRSPEIGSLAKVQGVVLCSFVDMGSEWAIQCRLIPLRTGTWAATAAGRLPKASVSSDSVRAPARRPSYLGTIYLGEDGLELRVSEVSKPSGSNAIRVKYTLYNGGNREASARLVDPEERAYVVDAAGNTFPFMGSEGFSQQEVRLRPGSRSECSLVFRVPADVVAYARVYVEWDLSGRSWGGQKNFFHDIPASALQ